MRNFENFLAECAYYPCSGTHGAPIKFLLQEGVRYFLLTDYHVTLEQYERDEFRGYRRQRQRIYPPHRFFGVHWKNFKEKSIERLSRVGLHYSDPFVVWSVYQRLPNFSDNHGPENFEIIFAQCEAIETYTSIFSARAIVPKYFLHICPGLAFGGNFNEYIPELKGALIDNDGGLPEFMLVDELGIDRFNRGQAEYLDLITKKYDRVKSWGVKNLSNLYLYRIKDSER